MAYYWRIGRQIDKQTDGQKENGGSVHRLIFPSLVSEKNKNKKKTHHHIFQGTTFLKAK